MTSATPRGTTGPTDLGGLGMRPETGAWTVGVTVGVLSALLDVLSPGIGVLLV